MELATRNEDKTDNLIIYYQNTRSLHNQKDGLTTIFLNKNPKSLSEVYIFKWTPCERQWNNNLTAIFCWNKDLKVVCSLTGIDIIYQTADIKKEKKKTCKKIAEISAVKLQTKSNNLIICCIYRAPTGNINQYLELLDNTLKHLHHSSVELLLCGDMSFNYVTENKNNLKLNIQ